MHLGYCWPPFFLVFFFELYYHVTFWNRDKVKNIFVCCLKLLCFVAHGVIFSLLVEIFQTQVVRADTDIKRILLGELW